MQDPYVPTYIPPQIPSQQISSITQENSKKSGFVHMNKAAVEAKKTIQIAETHKNLPQAPQVSALKTSSQLDSNNNLNPSSSLLFSNATSGTTQTTTSSFSNSPLLVSPSKTSTVVGPDSFTAGFST